MQYLLLLLVFSLPASAEPFEFNTFGPRLTATYEYDFTPFLPADRLRLQEISDRVSEWSRYEDFLDYLETRRPQLFENMVLIHDSGSLQYADREHPRAIVFGDGLMLAFAENPQRSERTVEMISFEGSRFQFAELSFNADGARYTANPVHCQSCHGTNLKPLWDPYDFWPNAYGSAIAKFGTVAERTAYEALRTKANKTGVYRRLKWPTLPASNVRGVQGIETFTQYVSQLQTLATVPAWRKDIVPAALALLMHCAVDSSDEAAAQKLASYVPESWRARVIADFPAWHLKVKNARKALKTYQTARYQNLFQGSAKLSVIDHERLGAETQTVAQLYLLLELAGMDMRDWSMSQGPNPYLMSVPSNRDADLATDLALAAPEVFQELKPSLMIVPKYEFTWARFNCSELQTVSLQKLAGKETVSNNREFRMAPTVFGECMACHSLEAKPGIPPIPFDRTTQLREFLQTAGGLEKILDRIQRTGAGQMPPYRHLSATEAKVLRENLERIGRDTDVARSRQVQFRTTKGVMLGS